MHLNTIVAVGRVQYLCDSDMCNTHKHPSYEQIKRFTSECTYCKRVNMNKAIRKQTKIIWCASAYFIKSTM